MGDTLPVEEWRALPGPWGAHYEASSLGRIRRRPGTPKCLRGRVLRPRTNAGGYLAVVLCQDGRPHQITVHRLIATAFHGEQPADAPTVNHKNGVKTDNRPENLEWVSYSANSLHGYATGLIRPAWTGKRPPYAKLTDDTARAIYQRRDGKRGTARRLALEYGVSAPTVWKIWTGRSWSRVTGAVKIEKKRKRAA